MPVTRLIKINPQAPDIDVISEAANILKNGGLVAFPTETVYGLGANARDARAVQRIYNAKGRPSTDPLIVHIASLNDLHELSCNAPDIAYRLAENFWPGPLTLVLLRSKKITAKVSGGLPSIGVRIPAHPVASLLLRIAQIPVAAPSANLFSHTSPTEASHVLEDLDGRVDIILDGGACPIGVESTVLDLVSDPPEILRPGGISFEELIAFIPSLKRHDPHRATQKLRASMSPGMFPKHYAPHTALRVLTGSKKAISSYLSSLIQDTTVNQLRIGLLITDEVAEGCAICRSETTIVIRLGRENELAKIASRLFASLRSLDQADVDCIYAFLPDDLLIRGGLGPAIYDRLRRAASGNITELKDGIVSSLNQT
jgi:L-threonylcarbamoyladenylate synthase